MILPWLGEGAFATLSTWGKIAHNYVGWAFMVGLILSFLVWVVTQHARTRSTRSGSRRAAGLLKKGVHPPAKKFNAGQKLIFWSVTLGGAALSFTGVMLLFPALAGTEADWQLYQTDPRHRGGGPRPSSSSRTSTSARSGWRARSTRWAPAKSI